MLPPRTSLDPEGHYDRLGVEPSASRAAIVAAFRAKARVLHPDVPVTGNAQAFVAVKSAYDVLSSPDLREAYDRKAIQIDDPGPGVIVVVHRDPYSPDLAPIRFPRIPNLSVKIWIGLGAFLCLCLYEAAAHILAPVPDNRAGIRPNAQTVAPLSPADQLAELYGPAPVRLAGIPNIYIVPAGSPAILWRLDPDRKALVPLGQLPPFSALQAIRLIRPNGLLEVLVNDKGNGFVAVDHVTPGNAAAAHTAYCGYNAGPTPANGEQLERRGSGNSTLALLNRAAEPAVVKLRDQAGGVMLSVFLEPGGHANLGGLPDGLYRPDFGIGELWSRACNSFAAGMRAQRLTASVRLPGDARITVSPDLRPAEAVDIPDQTFAKD